jgi:RNA polymerase sigma-70 factor (ECF subfamily)
LKKIDEKELHDLFNGFKERNQSSYNQLYEKYYKLVYGIAFSVMKNKEDSEDIANEVFTKIYRLDKEKLPVSNEASWLFTVTRNECFSYLRKSRQNISIDEIYEVPSKSQELEGIIDSEYYNKLISGLSEQEKTIISLKILSDFTFSKIAQIMNLPIGTVQWKYYKAINSLKVSIGSLAGAAIAFMLVFLRREKISKETPYTNTEKEKSETYKSTKNSEIDNVSEAQDSAASQINVATSSIENNINEKSMATADSEKASVITEIASPAAENIHSIDVYSVAGITIGIAFLIIFIIFFKKYQQKFLKKKSK